MIVLICLICVLATVDQKSSGGEVLSGDEDDVSLSLSTIDAAVVGESLVIMPCGILMTNHSFLRHAKWKALI